MSSLKVVLRSVTKKKTTMDRIQLSDVQSDTKLADVKLSSNYLSADKIVDVFNRVIDSAVDLQSD